MCFAAVLKSLTPSSATSQNDNIIQNGLSYSGSAIPNFRWSLQACPLKSMMGGGRCSHLSVGIGTANGLLHTSTRLWWQQRLAHSDDLHCQLPARGNHYCLECPRHVMPPPCQLPDFFLTTLNGQAEDGQHVCQCLHAMPCHAYNHR